MCLYNNCYKEELCRNPKPDHQASRFIQHWQGSNKKELGRGGKHMLYLKMTLAVNQAAIMWHLKQMTNCRDSWIRIMTFTFAFIFKSPM